MSCFRRSSGIYILNNVKKCKPVQDELVIEFTDVTDQSPAIPPVATTNGNALSEEEPKERRAGVQAPTVNVDENSSAVKKHPKTLE